jgi:hypothetical protein
MKDILMHITEINEWLIRENEAIPQGNNQDITFTVS